MYSRWYANMLQKKGKIMIKKILGIAVLFGLMMTAAQAKTFLVDVRTPSEIATTGKVEGALVANYSAPDFVDQFKALGAKPDDDIDIVIFKQYVFSTLFVDDIKANSLVFF